MFIAQWVYSNSDVVPIENFTWVSESRSSRPPVMNVTGSIVMTKSPNVHVRINSRTFGDFLLLRETIENEEVAPYAYDAIRSTALDGSVFRDTIERGATELPIRRDEILKHALRVAGAASSEQTAKQKCAAASLALVATDEEPMERNEAVKTIAGVLSVDAGSLHDAVQDIDTAVPQHVRSQLANRAALWR